MQSKKIIATTLALSLAIGCLASTGNNIIISSTEMQASAATTVYTRGNYKYTLNNDNNKATITKYNGNETNVSIPSSITYNNKSYTVCEIGEFAFNGNQTVTTLSIPGCVNKIDKCAFQGMSKLTSVQLNTGLTTIDEFAFNCCTNLKSLKCPASLSSIGNDAFRTCKSLSSVEFNNGLSSIGSDAFSMCFSLGQVHIPASLTDIRGDYTYFAIGSFESVSIDSNNPNYSTITGKEICNKDKTILYKYGGNIRDRSYTVPSSIKTIASSAFYGDTCYLREIIIPNTVTNVEKANFSSPRYDYSAFNYASEHIVKCNPGTAAYEYAKKAGNTISCLDSHVWSNDWTIEKEPTCSSQGTKSHHCMYCDDKKDITTIPTNDEHKYGDWTTTKKPTCTEAGEQQHKCSICGKTETQTIPMKAHNYGDWTTVTSPTCGTAGTKEHTCSTCGKKETETIPATNNHNYGDWTTVTPSTCGTTGLKEHTCSTCGKKETESIPATGTHNYSSEWTIDKAATCTKDGSKSHHCTVCGAKSDVTTIKAEGHTFSTEWTIDKEATCTKDGSKSHHCTTCDAKKDVTPIVAEGHNFVEIDKVESTATEEGHITYKCSVCGATKTTYIPKLGETTTSKPDEIIEPDNPSNTTGDSSSTTDNNDSSTTDDSSNTNKPVTPVVTKAKIASATKIAIKTYTGKQIKPAVKVTSGKKILKLNRDYTVKYDTNKIGKGTVTITGKGNYTGKIVKTFTIKPRKATIVLGTAKKKLVVRNAKRSEASKYQIQYSTNSKFKGAKTVNTKLTRKVLSAKSKKKYYVRARVIKTIGGKNYVGSWSAVKTIKVK